MIIYLLPLGAGNTKDDNWHHWSTPLNSFWCCSGSIAESFGKLMDSIYFHRQAALPLPAQQQPYTEQQILLRQNPYRSMPVSAQSFSQSGLCSRHQIHGSKRYLPGRYDLKSCPYTGSKLGVFASELGAYKPAVQANLLTTSC